MLVKIWTEISPQAAVQYVDRILPKHSAKTELPFKEKKKIHTGIGMIWGKHNKTKQQKTPPRLNVRTTSHGDKHTANSAWAGKAGIDTLDLLFCTDVFSLYHIFWPHWQKIIILPYETKHYK